MKTPEILFAGHSAVFITYDKLTLAIDPWLEGNPLCPEDLKNPAKLDLIILTHGHADHAGDTIRLAKASKCKVIANYELSNLLQNDGLPSEQLIGMNKGGTVQFNNFQITLTNAFHSSSYDTPTGTVYAGEACGVVIFDGNKSLYHAGDTCLFSDMQLIGKRYKPEVALLPIGDLFTMGPEEAAEAARLVGARFAIPIHYETFPMLTGTAEQFQQAVTRYDIEPVIIKPGKKWSWK